MDELKLSEFNEAAYKMARINELKKIINNASVNPLGFYMSDDKTTLSFGGKRNFEVKFECLCRLLMEIIPKLRENERASMFVKRDVLKQFIREMPIFKLQEKINGSETYIFNGAFWVVLDKELTDFEYNIEVYLDKHGFSGKEAKDPRMAITN